MDFKKIDFNKIFQSKKLRITLIVIGALIVLLIVFGVGMAVGFRKANFSFRWAENYHKNFAGPREGFFGDFRRDFEGRDFIEAHGVFGEIIELTKVGLDNAFIVRGRDDMEKIIITTKDTVVKKGMETMKDYLKVGDQVVIIGSPNDNGQIEAKLIRVMPSPLPEKRK